MKRKLQLLDSSTGETFDAPVYLNSSPQRRPTIYGNRWFQMAQDPLLTLAQDRELWGVTTAVLLYLCGRLDFDNWVSISQKDIAAHLKVKQPRISEAISKLADRGIIIRGPSLGRAHSYRLNPAYGWKGDNKKAQEYQLELIKGGRE